MFSWDGTIYLLFQVTWSHATNSIELLDNALKDGTMMIEADVSIGSGVGGSCYILSFHSNGYL